ncbi:MAG: putative selenium-dependent hydroxylase accessory protein YqeC [Candidatus Promineofilum sp.]|nr:putative selenium-dependent hydroxylase accessory protein YqeC [Promineifilum sp.]
MTADRWTLSHAFGIGERPELVAFVGGGGKTSLMFALVAELPGRTILTTTTRIFTAQMRPAPAVVYAGDLSPLDDLLDTHGRCLVVGRVEGDKALGVPPDLPARLLARPGVDFVLVEADGARMRPVKAPADHEPVIPLQATLVVPVAGIDALAGPLDVEAHRPELIRIIANDQSGISKKHDQASGQPAVRDGRLTPAGLARVLTHPSGGLKNVPATARIIPFINKIETAEQLTAAREAAALILREPRVSSVVLGTLHAADPVREVWRRVTAVVLAAGESRRMGRNKLLLPWEDTTVLGRTLTHVAASNVSDVIVVTGHNRPEIEGVASRHGITTLFNQAYAKGMLSSVQAAIGSLPPAAEAALVMLGDQPLIPAQLIDALLQAYAHRPHGLVAPVFDGRRGNPVIIDRRYFVELLALPPETAPRVLLQRHPDDVLLVEVGDDAILYDLDRPEDYERWRPR